MFLRLPLLIPLMKQFMLLEELCELDGPVWMPDAVDDVKKAAWFAARRVDWRDPRTVFTSATIRMRFGPFYKIVSAPVHVLDVSRAGNTHRYYLTRRGKLYQGYLYSELSPVDLTGMTAAGRSELITALDRLHQH